MVQEVARIHRSARRLNPEDEPLELGVLGCLPELLFHPGHQAHVLSERSRTIVVLVGDQAADVHDQDLAGPLPFYHLLLERLAPWKRLTLTKAHPDRVEPTTRAAATQEGPSLASWLPS